MITAVLTIEILFRSRRLAPSSRASIASWMLFGIWFFGPLCMMISASFSGGGFLSTEPWLLASAIVLFVPYTFMMSTYDGTLGALSVVTIWFFVVGAVGLTRRFKWIAKSAG